ncbi:hypothetical protein DFH09DRAFT_1087960 [Mycena vulgaris]|nr:hypothetical protein DFH09DRAFT_1087960 [Mycena vulgaris]
MAHCALRVVAPHAGFNSKALNRSAVRDEPEDRGESASEMKSETVLARSTKRKADMVPARTPTAVRLLSVHGNDERHTSELRRTHPEAKTHGITFRVKRRVLSSVESGTDNAQMGGGRGWRQNPAWMKYNNAGGTTLRRRVARAARG